MFWVMLSTGVRMISGFQAYKQVSESDWWPETVQQSLTMLDWSI